MDWLIPSLSPSKLAFIGKTKTISSLGSTERYESLSIDLQIDRPLNAFCSFDFSDFTVKKNVKMLDHKEIQIIFFIPGLRDVDPNEWKYIHQFSIPSYPMQTIDRYSHYSSVFHLILCKL